MHGKSMRCERAGRRFDEGVRQRQGINPEMLGQLGQAPAPSKEGNGTALYNVNQRLTGLFGHQAALQIASELDKGTEISFKIPFQTEREGNRDAQGINRG